MLPKPRFLIEETPQSTSHYQQNRGGPNNGFNHRFRYDRNNPKFQLQQSGPKKNLLQCDYDGCRFQSSSEEMVVHKKISHFQLCSRFNDGFLMDSPEEISKWRAERRSKFPKLSSNDSPADKHTEHLLNPDTNHEDGPSKNNAEPRFNSNNHWRGRPTKRTNQRFTHQRNQHFTRTKNQFRHRHKPMKNGIKSSPPKSNSNSNNSLNLLSCYASDCSDDENGTPNNTHRHSLNEQSSDQVITTLIDEIISRVEQNVCIDDKKRKNISSADKKDASNKKLRKHPFNPNQNLYYSKLNLFQKLMLQDVRKIKDQMLYCLKLIQDNNYLENV